MASFVKRYAFCAMLCVACLLRQANGLTWRAVLCVCVRPYSHEVAPKWTGYLDKKGGGKRKLFGRRNWRKRFLVLDHGTLAYWTEKYAALQATHCIVSLCVVVGSCVLLR